MKGDEMYRGIPREPPPSWWKIIYITYIITQLMAIQAAHNETNREALLWAKMLANPSDFLERAPSSTPFLASKARFVRSFDIPYADTHDGSFAISAMPFSEVCAAVTSGATIQLAATPISLTSIAPASCNEGSSYLTNVMYRVVNRNTAAELGTISTTDGGVINPSLGGIPVIRVATPNPFTNVQTSIRRDSPTMTAVYYRVGVIDAATFNITYSTPTTLNNAIYNVATVNVAGVGIVLQLCTADGTPITNRSDLKCTVFVDRLTATSASVSSSQSFDLLRSEVLDAGKVGNHRCTAMSMLVTNMAPPLVSGGELVIARCPFSVVSSGVPETIMTTIKQLPEERYWRSGAIKDGGYAWWMPDDLQSYEPNPYPEASQPENILVAAGKMSDPGGFVRVLITYIFEFYTPVQLFSRDYNFTYNPMVQDLWSQLVMRPAVSANAGHAALIAGAIALAQTVYSFYQGHKDLLDPLAKMGYRAVKKKLKNDLKKREGGPKSKPPPTSNPKNKPGGAQTRTKQTGAVSK